jgi:hypothetical protein
MALEIRLTVKDDGSAVIEQVGGKLQALQAAAEKSAGGMSAAWGKLKASWVEITATVLALKGALDLMHQAATFEEDIGRLDHQLAEFNMSARELIPTLKELSQGQLSLADAARVASKGLAAGLNPEQLQTFVEMGTAVASVMHTDIPNATETMISAISGGRGALLKQMGIYVDLEQAVKQYAVATNRSVEDITEAEKAHIRLLAAVSEMPDALKRISDGTVSMSAQMKATEATIHDLELQLGRALIGMKVLALGAFQVAAASILKIAEFAATQMAKLADRGVMSGLQRGLVMLLPWGPALIELNKSIGKTAEEWRDLAKDFGGAATETFEKGFDTMQAGWDRLTKAANPLADSVKRVAGAHKDATPPVVNLKNELEKEKVQLEAIKLASAGSIDWLKKLESQSQALADRQKDLIAQQIALREQSALSLRELTKPLAMGKVDLLFPTDQATDPSLRLLKMRQQFDALGDQEAQAIADMKKQIAPLLADLPATVQAQMLVQSGKAIHDSFTKDKEALLGPMRDLMGQLFAPATVEKALAEFQAQILQGNIAFLAQEQDLISQQQQQVKAAIDTFTQIVDAAAGNMQKIADKMREQMKAATLDVRKSFQDALQGIARDIQALYQAIAAAQASVPLALQTPFSLAPPSQPNAAITNSGQGWNAAAIASLHSGELNFATGGSFTVGGSGGVDRTPVGFMATRGEQVTVTPPGRSAGGGVVVNQTINGGTFMAPGQFDRMVRQELARSLRKAQMRQGTR